jgi:non-specific serine/threonine protein kinase
MGGQFEGALKWYRRWLQIEPKNPAAMHATAGALTWNQRFDEAAALFEEVATVAPGSPLSWYRGFVLPVLRGDRAGALAGVKPELAAAASSFEVSCWSMAAFHAIIDARDEALEWLERAVRRGFINYPLLAEYDPFLKRLRGEQRFTRLLEEVKRKWESLQF